MSFFYEHRKIGSMDAKTLCLGALTCGDASGYEIKKLFEEGPFAYFYQVSFGSIYPSLAKLCEEGKITMREEDQEGRPDKKVYSLTDAGRAALRTALKKTPANDKMRSEILVMFFLEAFMEPGHLHEVFHQQLDYYKAALSRVEELDDTGTPPERIFIRGLGRIFYRTVVEYMEENAHLILDKADENGKKLGAVQ